MAQDGEPEIPEVGLVTDQDPHADIALADVAPADESVALEAPGAWRAAKSLLKLQKQVNAAYPQRGKASDGMIGDGGHQARTSDHNAWIKDDASGVVSAYDITHDPAHGCDAGAIVDAIRAARDKRVKYLIWNRRIANASPIGAAPAWAWRAYTGKNPHNHHCHISVKAEKALYDDESAWALPSAIVTEAAPQAPPDDETQREAIGAALAALPGETGKPLLEALVDAQDQVAMLLALYSQTTRVPAKDEEDIEPEAAVPEAPSRFQQWKAQYERLYADCRVTPAKAGEVAWHRKMLLKNKARYDEVAARTGAPWWFIGIVHGLEASFNFAGHLHNGDPLSARTVQVPSGRPPVWNPPSDWVSSAVDAITYEKYAGLADWSLAITLYRLEGYNGYAYHKLGINSPYLWSFSNHYAKGKFVRDGVYDPNAVSKQCGAAVMIKALVQAGDITAP
jgi:lysozyme family protein